MDEELSPSWDTSSRQDTLSLANRSDRAELRGPDERSMTDAERPKIVAVLQACKTHSLNTLITLATAEHGLIDDEVRRKACTFYGSVSTKQVELT